MRRNTFIVYDTTNAIIVITVTVATKRGQKQEKKKESLQIVYQEELQIERNKLEIPIIFKSISKNMAT